MTIEKYLLAPAIVWVVSQTLKVLYRIFIRKEKASLQHIWWIYMYGDGTPSTHSAILTSMLTIVWNVEGVGLLFYVALIISLIFAYNLLEDRKKQTVFEGYLNKSGDQSLRAISPDGKMMDMSGHNISEIFFGGVLGIILGILIFNF